MEKIFNKIEKNEDLTQEDAISLLELTPDSEYFHKLLSLANSYSRKKYNNKGIIFAQIGLDTSPCSVNCKFCSMAKDCFDEKLKQEKSKEEVIEAVKIFIGNGASEIFLMTTADYNNTKFLEMVKAVREIMPSTMPLVANVGDFSYKYALEMKSVGVTGVYHICRLGEGVDTLATVETRINTLNSIKKAELDLYYCVEPIGPEHSNEQIVTEIFRGKEYAAPVMAVMKRVAVKGSLLYERGEINSIRLAQICAVTVLCTKASRAMGVHEPDIFSMISGANQIYAEQGANPRDVNLNTELGRGCSVSNAFSLLKQTGWEQ